MVSEDLHPIDILLDDCVEALRLVREQVSTEMPLALFGHCLGGSVLAGLLHYQRFDIPYDAAVFCSTWLGRLHCKLTEQERAALLQEESDELWDAGLKAGDFTDDPKYRHYIESDPLATRQLTRRSRDNLYRLEHLYMGGRKTLPSVPFAYVSGLSDPIVDLQSNQRVFKEMVGGRGTMHQFPTDKHYLFFTDVRPELVNWASAFTIARGFR